MNLEGGNTKTVSKGNMEILRNWLGYVHRDVESQKKARL